jgi:hypothetical protein
VAWLWSAAALSGCQGLGPGRSGTSGDESELIRYGNEVRRLESAALEQEYRDLVAEYATTPTGESAVRLSLLLSRPGASFYDIDRAIRLLGETTLGFEENEPPNLELTRFLYNLLSERSCVAANDGALAEMLNEERSRNARLDEELVEARSALSTERQFREMLQAQLNALRALEQEINSGNLNPAN